MSDNHTSMEMCGYRGFRGIHRSCISGMDQSV